MTSTISVILVLYGRMHSNEQLEVTFTGLALVGYKMPKARGDIVIYRKNYIFVLHLLFWHKPLKPWEFTK